MKRIIKFHKATWLDCLFLFHLRNQPETYKYFRNARSVKFFEHLKWYSKLMSKTSNKQLFVITVNDNKAGQIRFDKIEKNCADISISILKQYMGQGVMSSIFFDVARWYLSKNQAIKKLTAQINVKNIPSTKLFLKLGFRKSSKKDKGWVSYARGIENI